MKAPGTSLAVRSWSDVAALGTLLVMALAGLAWGLKLDNRAADLERGQAADGQRLSGIETVLGVGMLPATAARLTEFQREIDVCSNETRLLHQRDIELTDRIAATERLLPRR